MRDDSCCSIKNKYYKAFTTAHTHSSVQLRRRALHLATLIRPGLEASLGGLCRMLQTNFGESLFFYEVRE
jgi:hypothetical protein